MSSIKDLKKDINYLTYEIIADCNICMSAHPEKKDEIIKIVEKAVNNRNELISRVNNPDYSDKSFFTKIKMDLLNYADSSFEQLRNVIK